VTEDLATRLSTGIAGLDEVLRGGLIPGRAYLLCGGPGAGKTMVGLHFLTSGYPDTEKPLFTTIGTLRPWGSI
jgi:circadian clock protein KaiC